MRYFLFFLSLSISLFAKDLDATYRVSFGIFGEIGIAKTTLHVEGKRYKITVHAKSTGFAAFISGDREEFYESRGKIEDGMLVPDRYEKITQKNVNESDAFSDENRVILKKYVKIYTFNHKLHKIEAKKIKSRGKQKSRSIEKVKFYAKNDILSLFFNFKRLFPQLEIKKKQTLHAVGADKKTGKIVLLPLDKTEFAKLIDGEFRGMKFLKVILNDKIFSSKKGELYLALDKNGLCEKAVLKDVILFGDIRGELIEKNY